MEVKGKQHKVRFKKKVKESIIVDSLNLWYTFKNDVLQACDELCGKKKSRKNHENTWWWNEKMKGAIQQKKVAYKKMSKN